MGIASWSCIGILGVSYHIYEDLRDTVRSKGLESCFSTPRQQHWDLVVQLPKAVFATALGLLHPCSVNQTQITVSSA
jgi:hypothetical protein